MSPFVWSIVLALLQVSPTNKHLMVAPSASRTTVAPGAKLSLYLDVAPKPGIHVYAPGAKDYLPIALKLGATPGVSGGAVAYPKPQTLLFEGQKIPVYDKPFRLTQDVTIDRAMKEGALTLSGTLAYQACTDEICFIPATTSVSWTLTVSKNAKE